MSNNPFKLEFTLKQHTPLIHFQHDQEGAIIRATELKPKLDDFLIKNYPELTKPSIKKSLSPDKRDSLDYKVLINIHKKHTNANPKLYLFGTLIKDFQKKAITTIGIEPIDKSPYFADNENIKNGNYQDSKIGVMYEEADFDINLTLFCFNKSLLKIIDESIDAFFALNNFGTRQSKGFGSFTTSRITNYQDFERILKNNNGSTFYFIPRNDIIDIFKTINKENQELKSGTVNLSSGLKEYYEKKNSKIIWDKDALELYFGDNEDKTKHWYFLRALLGLSSNHAYEKGKLSHLRSIEIREITGTIERIPSPIFFKVFKGKIYVFAKDIDSTIYSKTFSFTPKQNNTNVEPLQLNTPPLQMQLNVNHFLDLYLNKKWKEL